MDEAKDDGLCWCGSDDYRPHERRAECVRWEQTEGELERSAVAREHWLLARVDALEVEPAEPTLSEVVHESRALVRELGAERLELVGASVLLAQEVRALRLSLQELVLRSIHASAGAQSFEDAGMGSPSVEWQRKLAATEHALALAQGRLEELEHGTPAPLKAPVSVVLDYEERLQAAENRARAAEAEANTLRAANAHKLMERHRGS
jgi:hypothetical protein